MSHFGGIYLGIVVTAFLIFAATLFWEMVTSGAPPPTSERRHDS